MVTSRHDVAEVYIGGRPVGSGHPTFVIAEAGINHGGDLEEAKRLVGAAARAGADAIKFQTYTTELRVAHDSPIFDVLKRSELDSAAHAELKRVAADAGILFMSTAFDPGSVDLLSSLGVCAIKIASFDCTNLELLRRARENGLPVVLSTGMADEQEIAAAAAILRGGAGGFTLLHCVSAYPAEINDVNLLTIAYLAERHGVPVGFSDHTIGTDAPVWAVLAGAQLIEKHFTTDKTRPGPDHVLSADETDLRVIVGSIRRAERALGEDPRPRLLPSESGTTVYRRFSR